VSTSAVRIVEAVLSAAVWLMKLNRLSSGGSRDDESGGGGGGSCSPMVACTARINSFQNVFQPKILPKPVFCC